MPRAPRVLLASQVTISGVAICMRELIRGGVAAGFELTVACPEEGDLRRWAVEAGAHWEHLELVRSPHLSDLPGVARMRRLATTTDVIHLHSSKAGAVGRLALAGLPASRRPPCAFTPHGWSWLVGGALAPAYRSFEALAARMTHTIVAVSQDEAAAGRAVLGRSGRRLRVIENGVDTERFSPVGPVAERSEGPLLVCVGRLAWHKGQEVAVRALARMADKRARLRLVGAGADRDAIGALAGQLGVADRVEMIGLVADTAPHLRAADVVVVPSRYEGLALVLLEAMACAKPIVATASIGSSAVEGAGILVPVEDEAALAAGVEEVLRNPALGRRLGDSARQRAKDRFSLERSVAQNLDMWRELAA